jgi:DNA-binding MarR family transcriptional regulator
MNKEVILSDLLKEIRINYQLLRKGVEVVHKGSDLSIGVRAVIEILNDQGAMTVPHLAKTRHMSRQSIQVMVDEMLKMGWLETKPNPFHKKSSLIELTAEGKKAYKNMQDQEIKHMKKLNIDVPVKKLEEALKLVEHINKKIDLFLRQ